MPEEVINDPEPGDKVEKESEEEEKETGVPITEFISDICKGGEKTIQEWHERLMRDPPAVDAFLMSANAGKNRYPNIMLYDRTRVPLNDRFGGDYIHASLVGYILSQAPFNDDTEVDFWRMINQYKPNLIVLLGALVIPGNQRVMKQFWPQARQERDYCEGGLKLKCSHMDPVNRYEMVITLYAQKGVPKSDHPFTFMHYRKWTSDQQVPDNLLEFRAMMKIAAARAEKDRERADQLVFICPSGVHRCGVLAAVDIVIERMTVSRKVGLKGTVEQMRKQRYGVFHNFETYSQVAEIVVRHAVSSGIVDPTFIGTRKR